MWTLISLTQIFPEALKPFLLKKNERERNFQMLLPFWRARVSSTSDKAVSPISCRMLEAPPQWSATAPLVAMVTLSVFLSYMPLLLLESETLL